jgi:hypothetical protein
MLFHRKVQGLIDSSTIRDSLTYIEDTTQIHNSTSRMGDMRTHVNTLAVKLNDGLFTELLKAASEATDEAEPLTVEEYASEIIEAYMATRRLVAGTPVSATPTELTECRVLAKLPPGIVFSDTVGYADGFFNGIPPNMEGGDLR